MRITLLFVACSLCLGCGRARSTPPAPPALRLPDDLVPSGCRASLELDPASGTFHGHVELDVRVRRATGVVWLDAQDLAIDRAALRAGGADVPLTVLPEPRDFVGLRGRFVPGEATLLLDYTGRQDVGRGLGIVRHPAKNDWYVVTQFEPSGARRVFPSFDEPGFKVPWTLDLTVPAADLALGNEPIEREEALPDGRKRVHFRATPPLPSYLIAFAVGPFDAVDGGRTAGGAPIRIIVPRGRGAEAAYSAAETRRIVAALEDYTGLSYPFHKLDMLAIPNGLGGAMENPGLITYGERFLLIAPDESVTARAAFASIAAHELSHMWFGDLVTMQWWDDLWLNEAFATWMTPKIVKAVHPEFAPDVTQAYDRARALDADSLSRARSIRQPITAAADIGAAFDGITYAKGATVLRMFEEWLGEDAFRAGVRAYLRAHAGGNATAADFLAAIGQAAGRDVAGPFGTFLDRPGEPLVEMELHCPADGPATLALSQRRFLARGARTPEVSAPWSIPVCVEADGVPRCTLLDGPSATLPLGPTCPLAIDPLPGAVGYYRVRLGPALLAQAPPPARAEHLALFGDETALVFAGVDDAAKLLAELGPLGNAPDPFLAAAAAGVLERFAPLVADADHERFAHGIRNALGFTADRAGWLPRPGEGLGAARLHGAVLPVVAVHGADRAAADGATALAAAWVKDPDAVPQSLWSAVLGTAVEVAPATVVPELTARLSGETESRILRPIYQALSAVGDPAQRDTLLARLLDGPAVTQDELALLHRPWRIALQARQFDFVRDHWDALFARTPADFRGALMPFVCDAARRDEVAAFLRAKFATLPEVGELDVAQQVEAMDRCIAENAALGPALAAVLDRQFPASGS